MTSSARPQHSYFRLFCLTAVALWISACGQIGPLYLPDTTPPAPAAETLDEEQEQQDNP